MKLSTKGRYGLRAVLYLAENSKEGVSIPLSQVAEDQEISINYLEHIFSQLKKTGILKSIKGSNGGYTISSNINQLSAGDVLRALEGDLSITEDSTTNVKLDSLIKICIQKKLWDPINEKINNIVDEITLAELVERQRELKGQTEPMYYI